MSCYYELGYTKQSIEKVTEAVGTKKSSISSRVNATLEAAMSVGRSVCRPSHF